MEEKDFNWGPQMIAGLDMIKAIVFEEATELKVLKEFLASVMTEDEVKKYKAEKDLADFKAKNKK